MFWILWKKWILRPRLVCFFFITQFPSLNFRHSSLITHYSSPITHHFKYYTRLAPSLNFHHLIFFTPFVGLIPVTHCRLFFIYLFFLPNLTKPSEKKKRKKKKTQNRLNQWKKRKKKREETQNKPKWKKKEEEEKKKRTEQPTRRRKEKKKRSKVVKNCDWVLFVGPYMCLITILSLSYELWKLKTAKMCFQFP